MSAASPSLDHWVRSYAAELAPAASRSSEVRWVETPSGARLAFVGGVVAKLHRHGTDAHELANRLAALGDSPVADLFVPPLDLRVHRAPDGSLATWWPEVEVLSVASEHIPWSEVGRLLARLHQVPDETTRTEHSTRIVPAEGLGAPNGGLPASDWLGRLDRAVERSAALPSPVREVLQPLGVRLLREAAEAACERKPAQRHTRMSLCHGDFHLGQLARQGTEWRLLDIDDLGVGDPWWDLARPAGFWAAGLLDDQSWHDLLDGYGVTDDPWPWLDLPARCAVLVAAVRAVGVQPTHSDNSADSLLAACRQM